MQLFLICTGISSESENSQTSSDSTLSLVSFQILRLKMKVCRTKPEPIDVQGAELSGMTNVDDPVANF